MANDIWKDLRYAVRSLARTPGFASAAIVTVALGVGINTGVFSVINAVLFRDLSAPDAHELVSISQTIEGVPDREGATALGAVSTAEYRIYRDRSRTLSGIAGHSEPTVAMLGGEARRQIVGLLVTCEYFAVLEQPPALGRGLREQDCNTGADPVVVLGHDLWATELAADPAVVGRTVELNRQLFTVAGIAREGTYGGRFEAGFFAPVAAEPLLLQNEGRYANDRDSWLFLIGRRNDGVGTEEVRAELGVIAAQIDLEHPGRVTSLGVGRARPDILPPFVRDAALGAAAVIMTAFGLVLLVACVNVANLLLARGTARSRELAVRLSLGASRARLIRHLLTESMLLWVAGGVLGSMLAFWSFQALLAFAMPMILPVGLPLVAIDASPDLRVLTVTAALTLGTGVLFGLVPALDASRTDPHAVMKQDSAGSPDRGSSRLQAMLVGAQVALCMALMIGAGLLLRGLYAAQTLDPGFGWSDVAVLSYDYAEDTGHENDPAFWQRLIDEVSALPGVESAAYAMREPLGDDFARIALRLPTDSENELRFAELNIVSPDYFSTVEIPLVLGRMFTDIELANDSGAVIVSESTARNFWGDADPIGRTLSWRTDNDEDVELRIVGVVEDAQVRTLGSVDPYFVYMPGRFSEKLLVKSSMDFASTSAAIRGVVRALDPALPAPVYGLEANLDRWRAISGLLTSLAAALGALALVLSAVGIYGIVSYFVGRRFREIGIRIALGAGTRSIYRLILGRTMRPVVVGAAIGIAGAAAVSGILSGVLFGVSPVDPLGLGAATLFVLGVALASGACAASRAMRVDPVVTLRHD